MRSRKYKLMTSAVDRKPVLVDCFETLKGKTSGAMFVMLAKLLNAAPQAFILTRTWTPTARGMPNTRKCRLRAGKVSSTGTQPLRSLTRRCTRAPEAFCPSLRLHRPCSRSRSRSLMASLAGWDLMPTCCQLSSALLVAMSGIADHQIVQKRTD